MVVYSVTKGDVTTGMVTTGTIQATQVLDLNVYKLSNRITTVSVQNGMKVKKGQLLFSFDQSDAAVAVANSVLGVQQAEIALSNKQAGITDPNTTITSLQNDIATLEKNLAQYPEDKKAALRTFMSANLEAIPSPLRYGDQEGRVHPIVGGLYTSTEEGTYTITVYKSTGDSGYSFSVRGLENDYQALFQDQKIPLGTRGLTLTFPDGSISTGDVWVVTVPNKNSSQYPVAQKTYTDTLTSIDKSIASDTVTLTNKKILLAQAGRSDTGETRNLDLQSASLAIQQARVNLQKNIDTQNERKIIAPFDGTIEGMENVVVGASPTKNTDDPIKLGSLVSNDFTVSFSLGAAQVNSIVTGQKVLITLSSAPQHEPLTAEVTEVSSLPGTGSVPEYAVRAHITTDLTKSDFTLRDGMLADVTIVQKESLGVIRVPTSAISYSDGQARVTVIDSNLSQAQKTQIAQSGILRLTNTSVAPTTITKTITLGLRGQYYNEVVSGLSENELVVVSTSTVTKSTAAQGPNNSGSVVRTQRGGGEGTPKAP